MRKKSYDYNLKYFSKNNLEITTKQTPTLDSLLEVDFLTFLALDFRSGGFSIPKYREKGDPEENIKIIIKHH